MSPGEGSLEVKKTYMFGSVCSRDPLKLLTMWLILLIFLRISFTSTDPDVEGEALIQLLRGLNDSNNQISDWNNYFVTPCYSCSHVTCRNGNVISLSLASNGFSGTLSPSITKMNYLVSLELQNKNLSGFLPDYIANMTHLQNLNLAKNNFNGSIPATWGQLSSLKHLILRGNRLSGSIPDAIASIAGLAELDLSSNNLIGSIPMRLFSVPTFNFAGTDLNCSSSLEQPCVSNALLPVSTNKSKVKLVITSACGAFVLLAICAIIAYRYHYIYRLKDDVFVDVSGEDESKISLGQLRRFSWRELQLTIDNFSESNIIGRGGFGKVYRGVLSDKTKVAVKRLVDYYNPSGEAAFQREVQLISVAAHRNLLCLIGFCTTSTERLLVYPFMPNLSVAYHLRAHGLEYLHEHCNPKISDLKAANILLDDDFEAVLGDFGLAKLVDTRLTHVTTQVRGTMGHIAPEYLSTGKSSEKTDVFGYGITLLELVTDQRAIDFSWLEEEDVILLDHIKKLLGETRLEDIVDSNLKTYEPKEVETFVQVALLCTQSSPEDRPTMAQVVKMLQGVDLAERWAEWKQLEGLRNQEFSLLSQFVWADESAHGLRGYTAFQSKIGGPFSASFNFVM